MSPIPESVGDYITIGGSTKMLDEPAALSLLFPNKTLKDQVPGISDIHKRAIDFPWGQREQLRDTDARVSWILVSTGSKTTKQMWTVSWNKEESHGCRREKCQGGTHQQVPSHNPRERIFVILKRKLKPKRNPMEKHFWRCVYSLHKVERFTKNSLLYSIWGKKIWKDDDLTNQQ